MERDKADSNGTPGVVETAAGQSAAGRHDRQSGSFMKSKKHTMLYCLPILTLPTIPGWAHLPVHQNIEVCIPAHAFTSGLRRHAADVKQRGGTIGDNRGTPGQADGTSLGELPRLPSSKSCFHFVTPSPDFPTMKAVTRACFFINLDLADNGSRLRHKEHQGEHVFGNGQEHFVEARGFGETRQRERGASPRFLIVCPKVFALSSGLLRGRTLTPFAWRW